MELYRRLPYRNELEEWSFQVGPGVRVLELGCGTGRLTRRLLELGACVTTVDNSPEMLQEVPESATRILSDIESLHLANDFQIVVLDSGLINHPLQNTRSEFARAARRHLVVGGRLLLQRQDPEWLHNAQAGSSGRIGMVTVAVERLDRTASPMTMTLRYEHDREVWRHSFSVVPLMETEIESLLSDAGFEDFHWLGSKRLWVEAKAANVSTPLASCPTTR